VPSLFTDVSSLAIMDIMISTQGELRIQQTVIVGHLMATILKIILAHPFPKWM